MRSPYRSPPETKPILTPEEERKFLRALRPVPWFSYVYFTIWALLAASKVASSICGIGR